MWCNFIHCPMQSHVKRVGNHVTSFEIFHNININVQRPNPLFSSLTKYQFLWNLDAAFKSAMSSSGLEKQFLYILDHGAYRWLCRELDLAEGEGHYFYFPFSSPEISPAINWRLLFSACWWCSSLEENRKCGLNFLWIFLFVNSAVTSSGLRAERD